MPSPKVIVSASCGIEIKKVIPYKPLLDGAIDMAAFKPKACIILQRPMETAPWSPAVTWTGEAIARSEPADCVPGGSHRSALYTLHIGYHR
jgi:propionyl-CoA synthetase